METRIIIEKVYKNDDKTKRKGEVVEWSEAMRRFNLTTEQLKEIINNGTSIDNANVSYYLDEAITF